MRFFTNTGQEKRAQAVRASGLVVIEDKVLGAAASSVSFQDIPQQYKHLLIEYDALTSDAADQNMYCRFNGDVGANYDWQFVNTSAAVVTGGESLATNQMLGGVLSTSSSATARSSGVIRIPNYVGTTFRKGILTHNGSIGGTRRVFDTYGQWRNSQAITRVDLLPAAGNFVVGSCFTLFGIGDPVGAPLNVVGYGTVLPASPLDGQEFILVDSVSNPNYQWRFRYNAGSSSAYKWEFIGGTPVVNRSDSQATTASGTRADLGPSFTIPRAGDYLVAVGASMNNTSNGTTNYLTFTGGMGTNAYTVTNSDRDIAATEERVNGLAASTVIQLQGLVSGGTGQYDRRWIRVLPLRVS